MSISMSPPLGATVESAEITDSTIVNADIAAAAAIDYSKLATMATGKLLLGNANVPTATTLTNATLGATGALTAVTDAALNSPNNGIYRTIDTASAHLGSGITSGTFVMYPTTSSIKSAVDVVAGVFPIMWLAAADYAVNGLTTKVRVRLVVACNATAPGTQTFTGGLYPVTVAGGSSAFVPTLGTVTANTTAAVVNPSASTVQMVASADVTIPSDGAYCLGFTSSATTATNSFTKLYAHLQFRNV